MTAPNCLLHECFNTFQHCKWLTMFSRVVTYMSRVEVFLTGIKIESSDQSPFLEPTKLNLTDQKPAAAV